MSERMKELTTTEYVEVKFRIPSKKLEEVKKTMASYGVEEEDIDEIIQLLSIRVRVPTKKLRKVKQAMASYGVEEEGELLDSVPWKEVYPQFNASVALRGARKREGLTQKELALSIGVKQSHISEMEKGKRPIGKDLAKRLCKALNIDYRVFL
jgi:DNA-binding XRE family transcriptional regulator/predicted DNA binding CopG/RHH family protein